MSIELIRLLIGDTNEKEQFLEDEEINQLYELNSKDVYATASACARAIAAKLSKEVDESIGAVRGSYSQRAQAYLRLARELQRLRATMATFEEAEERFKESEL